MKPRIFTMRIGAADDEVIIDGHTFNRAGLSRNQRHAMASFIVQSLFPGSPIRQPRRPSSGPRRRVSK